MARDTSEHAHLASGFWVTRPRIFTNQKLRNAVQTSKQRLLGVDVFTAAVVRCVRWLRYVVAAMENRVVSPGPYRATKLVKTKKQKSGEGAFWRASSYGSSLTSLP